MSHILPYSILPKIDCSWLNTYNFLKKIILGFFPSLRQEHRLNVGAYDNSNAPYIVSKYHDNGIDGALFKQECCPLGQSSVLKLKKLLQSLSYLSK